MYRKLGFLVLILSSHALTLSMDSNQEYYTVPFINMATSNQDQLEELNDILNNPVLEAAKKGAISGATNTLTSSIITNSTLFLTSEIYRNRFDIYKVTSNIALSTLQGTQNGWYQGLQNGIINEIANAAPNKEHKNAIKVMLHDGIDGIKEGICLAQEYKDDTLKGAVIGGICGTLSGTTKLVAQATLTSAIDQPLALAVANNASEAAINYTRNATIKTAVKYSKNNACVIL